MMTPLQCAKCRRVPEQVSNKSAPWHTFFKGGLCNTCFWNIRDLLVGLGAIDVANDFSLRSQLLEMPQDEQGE
jgi:hypothetical protein